MKSDTRTKIRMLLNKLIFLYLKIVTFNRPVCLNMKIDGMINLESQKKGGFVGHCTFIGKGLGDGTTR